MLCFMYNKTGIRSEGMTSGKCVTFTVKETLSPKYPCYLMLMTHWRDMLLETTSICKRGQEKNSWLIKMYYPSLWGKLSSVAKWGLD